MSYVCLAIGIIIAQIWQIDNQSLLFYLFACSLIISALIYYRFNQEITKSNCNLFIKNIGFISLIILGFSYSNLRINYRLQNLITTPVTNLKLSGYLITPPTIHQNIFQAEFKVTKGHFINKKLLLSYPVNLVLNPGHNYTLQVSLNPLIVIKNINSFNYKEYLINQNINGLAYATNIISDNGLTYIPMAQINHLRVKMINYMHSTLKHQEYASLAIALVTGYQQFVSLEQWQVFKNSGIIHLVSISGLHITIVVAMCTLFASLIYSYLPLFDLPKQIFLGILGISVALFYSLIAGFSIPTARTFYMLLITIYLMINRHHIPLLQKFAITLCLVLLIEPFACVNSSF